MGLDFLNQLPPFLSYNRPDLSLWGFVKVLFLRCGVVSPTLNSPKWARVSLSVLDATFGLSGMGGPTRSYATTGLALRIIWPHKTQHCEKKYRYFRCGLKTLVSSNFPLNFKPAELVTVYKTNIRILRVRGISHVEEVHSDSWQIN